MLKKKDKMSLAASLRRIGGKAVWILRNF